jgi:hypothetical protein
MIGDGTAPVETDAPCVPGYNLQGWQEWRDSNPQPPVLETGALAIELHS